MKGLHTLCFILSALFATTKNFGQDSVSKLSIVFSPAMFMPVTVAVQAGIQIRLSKTLSFLTEAAYPTFYPDTEYEKIRYWRGGIQLKLHVPSSLLPGRYYALQANYLQRELKENDDGTVNGKDGVYRYDAANIKSPVLSVALILGSEIVVKKNKSFADVFIGIGARRLFNSYAATNLRITSIDSPRESFGWLLPSEGWRFDYTLTRLHFTAGLKFGLRL